MPGNNTPTDEFAELVNWYMDRFVSRAALFLADGSDQEPLTALIGKLNSQEILVKFKGGNNILFRLAEMGSDSSIDRINYIMSLIIHQAAGLDSEFNRTTLDSLLFDTNDLGLNLLHHLSLNAPTKLFAGVLNTTYKLMIEGFIGEFKYRNFIMSKNNLGYTALCWLLTLGQSDKLSVYFAAIKQLMFIGCFSAEDYCGLLLSSSTVSCSSFASYSQLDAGQMRHDNGFIITPFSLAFMALDPRGLMIYKNELQLSGISSERMISSLLVRTDNGYRLLDLLSIYGSADNFKLCLSFFMQAFKSQFISKVIYLDLLFKHLIPGHSLLHQLVMQHKLEKLECYTMMMSELLIAGVINEPEYLAAFMQRNIHGYTVVHQAVNTYNSEISVHVIQSLKDNLSDENYLQVLTARSVHKHGRPLLCQGKLHDIEINQLITNELQETRQRIESAKCPRTPDYFGFFPSMLHIPIMDPECAKPVSIRR